jgi:hypothetical protein
MFYSYLKLNIIFVEISITQVQPRGGFLLCTLASLGVEPNISQVMSLE